MCCHFKYQFEIKLIQKSITKKITKVIMHVSNHWLHREVSKCEDGVLSHCILVAYLVGMELKSVCPLKWNDHSEWRGQIHH